MRYIERMPNPLIYTEKGGNAMRKTARFVATAVSMASLVTGAALLPQVAQAADAAETIKMGKQVAFDRKLGNCLACHMIDDGSSPGDIGPPLLAMKARFPDPAKLRAQIWDSTKNNPGTRMPPFGKYKALSEEQIDAIVTYLYTL